MLEACAGKKREIIKIYQKEGGLFLEAEAGMIRLIPQTETILRVSYTEKETFSDVQGSHIVDLAAEKTENKRAACSWNYAEKGQEITLWTKNSG